MVRPASGWNVLERAKEILVKARTAEELRLAQAVVLPLEFGLTMDQTAKILGVSRGWACQLRRRFIASGGKCLGRAKNGRGGRRHECLKQEEEAVFLQPFFEKAAGNNGLLVVSEVKLALDEHLGRKISLATVYNLLHRHGWQRQRTGNRAAEAETVTRGRGENFRDPSLPQSAEEGPGRRRRAELSRSGTGGREGCTRVLKKS